MKKLTDLNRKQLTFIFEYLSSEDLSRLASTCRRLNNAVQFYVKELQVFVDWSEEDDLYNDRFEPSNFQFRPLTLRFTSPADFFSDYFPFHNLKELFISFDDKQNDKINLTKLFNLRYLKIRGQNIILSSNRLPSVTHLDIEDPNCTEKQVFPHLKHYNLEFNCQDFSEAYNTTETEGMKFAFNKSLDILLDKNYLELISFKITIPEMSLLLFEMFIDSLTNFLKTHLNEIDLGRIQVDFYYQSDYDQEDKYLTRWKKDWTYLEEDITYRFGNLILDFYPLVSA